MTHNQRVTARIRKYNRQHKLFKAMGMSEAEACSRAYEMAKELTEREMREILQAGR